MPKEKRLSPREIHENLTNMPKETRDRFMQSIGIKSVSSLYDRLNGTCRMSEAERRMFCEVYNVPYESVQWPEQDFSIA